MLRDAPDGLGTPLVQLRRRRSGVGYRRRPRSRPASAGRCSALTTTIVVTGRMSPKTSPWARPSSSQCAMSVTYIARADDVGERGADPRRARPDVRERLPAVCSYGSPSRRRRRRWRRPRVQPGDHDESPGAHHAASSRRVSSNGAARAVALDGAPSVAEVAAAGEDHRDAGRVGRRDDLVVAHRAAGLDDRGDARLDRRARGRRRTGRTRRRPARRPAASSTRAFSIARRTESTRLIWPAPMPTVAQVAREHDRVGAHVACRRARRTAGRATPPRSARRSVTTSISSRSSRSMSRSCTSRPPVTWRMSGSPSSGMRRSWSSRMPHVLASASSTSSASSS